MATNQSGATEHLTKATGDILALNASLLLVSSKSDMQTGPWGC
jgi:hypothetical protein